jgi:hypothetical protein
VIRTVAAAIHTAPKVGNLKRLQAVNQSDAFMHLSVRQIDGGFRLPPLSTLGNLQRPKSHARVKARARREWPGRHQHLLGGSCPQSIRANAIENIQCSCEAMNDERKSTARS